MACSFIIEEEADDVTTGDDTATVAEEVGCYMTFHHHSYTHYPYAPRLMPGAPLILVHFLAYHQR